VFCKEVITVSDTLYLILRKIRISDRPITEVWKEHLRADKVFKKEPYFYFCEEIVEVFPIEPNIKT